MPYEVSRLVLVLAYYYFATTTFSVLRSLTRAPLTGTRTFEVAVVIWSLLFVVLWWALWRRTVVWTARRRRQTGWMLAAALGAGVLTVGVVRTLEATGSGPRSEFALGASVGLLVWTMGTCFLWAETPQEKRIRERRLPVGPRCLRCGYNMKGLSEAQCPECGARYTLDELLLAPVQFASEEQEEAG